MAPFCIENVKSKSVRRAILCVTVPLFLLGLAFCAIVYGALEAYEEGMDAARGVFSDARYTWNKR